MSNNLKIEVVVSDIPENGVMDFSIVTKQQLEIELAKIPKLKDGYMDITYIPTEITRQLNELSETIEQLSESLVTDYQGIRRYCDSYIDSAVKDKADLVNGSVPPNQLTGLFLRDNLWEGSNRFVYTIKGNIETANKLKNPVKINGIDFDGSKSIELSKSNIGLGNVDNTADKDKPISDAVKIVLDGKANVVDVYTKTEVDQKTNISLDGTLTPNTSAAWGVVPQIKKVTGDISPELNAQAEVLLQMLNDVRKNGGVMPFDQDFANAIGGFDVGDQVKLSNGKIVISEIDNNQNNPNSDMTGWVRKFQNVITDVDSISALEALDVWEGRVVYILNEGNYYYLNNQWSPVNQSNSIVTPDMFLDAANNDDLTAYNLACAYSNTVKKPVTLLCRDYLMNGQVDLNRAGYGIRTITSNTTTCKIKASGNPNNDEVFVTYKNIDRREFVNIFIDANGLYDTGIDTSFTYYSGPSLNIIFSNIFVRGYKKTGWLAENNNDSF